MLLNESELTPIHHRHLAAKQRKLCLSTKISAEENQGITNQSEADIAIEIALVKSVTGHI